MNTLTADTALTHTNNTNSIPSTTNASPLPLETNTWGYNTTNNQDNFQAIPPPTGTNIKETEQPASTSQTTVTIGAIADTTLPAGTYTNTLQFTAVTNYVPPPATPMQTITTANCPTERTKAYDVRDNATYWIQKLADGKCWMLTNLAYAGGGNDTYNDVKTITNTNALSYTEPYYMIPPNSNKTTNPQDPSTSTDGGATNPQYGYLYNWCAAMGVQTTTSACMNATTPAPNQNISICPSGWRLPTGNTGGEYEALTTAIGATNNAAGSAALRSSWLGMYSGSWYNGFSGQGGSGFYWSSTQHPSYSTHAYYLDFLPSGVAPGTGSNGKQLSCAVRCLAL